MDDNVAFQTADYGLRLFVFSLGMPVFYYRVIPLALTLTLAGIGSSYLLLLAGSHDSILDGMNIIAGISGFFLSFTIAQETIYARTSTILCHERVSSVASLAARINDARAKKLVVSALMGRIHHFTDVIKCQNGYDATRKISEAIASGNVFSERDNSLLDRAFDQIALIEASIYSGSTKWCTRSMMFIMVLVFILPFSVGMFTSMGRAFVIPQLFVVVLFLGSYDAALEATNPFSPRYDSVLERLENTVNVFVAPEKEEVHKEEKPGTRGTDEILKDKKYKL
jgi:hypothetical protein